MLKAPELGGLVNVFDAVAWEAACSLEGTDVQSGPSKG